MSTSKYSFVKVYDSENDNRITNVVLFDNLVEDNSVLAGLLGFNKNGWKKSQENEDSEEIIVRSLLEFGITKKQLTSYIKVKKQSIHFLTFSERDNLKEFSATVGVEDKIWNDLKRLHEIKIRNNIISKLETYLHPYSSANDYFGIAEKWILMTPFNEQYTSQPHLWIQGGKSEQLYNFGKLYTDKEKIEEIKIKVIKYAKKLFDEYGLKYNLTHETNIKWYN